MTIFTFGELFRSSVNVFHNNTQTLRLQTRFYRHLVKICLITLLKCYDKRNAKLCLYIIRPKWPWVSDSFNSLMHILWSYHIQSGLANNIIVCIGHNQTCGNRAAPFEKQLGSNSYNTNTPMAECWMSYVVPWWLMLSSCVVQNSEELIGQIRFASPEHNLAMSWMKRT